MATLAENPACLLSPICERAKLGEERWGREEQSGRTRWEKDGGEKEGKRSRRRRRRNGKRRRRRKRRKGTTRLKGRTKIDVASPLLSRQVHVTRLSLILTLCFLTLIAIPRWKVLWSGWYPVFSIEEERGVSPFASSPKYSFNLQKFCQYGFDQSISIPPVTTTATGETAMWFWTL